MGSFEPGFAYDLARARVFISGFGVSFNEAVALETLPVCWPDSDAHRDDAERFYRHLGMVPLIIETPADVEGMLLPLMKSKRRLPRTIQDGTPNIVAEIAALFNHHAPEDRKTVPHLEKGEGAIPLFSDRLSDRTPSCGWRAVQDRFPAARPMGSMERCFCFQRM